MCRYSTYTIHVINSANTHSDALCVFHSSNQHIQQWPRPKMKANQREKGKRTRILQMKIQNGVRPMRPYSFIHWQSRRWTAWGDNNPKASMWQACLTALAGSEKESSGALKGVTILKSQWQKVCPSYIYVCAYLTSNYTVQLKWEYEIIKGLCNLLGVGWNEVMKRVKAEPSVWDAYCKVRLSCIYVGLHCSPHLPPPSESPQGESLLQEGLPTLWWDWESSWWHSCYWWIHVLGKTIPGPFLYLTLPPCYSPWRWLWLLHQPHSVGDFQQLHHHNQVLHPIPLGGGQITRLQI